MLGKERLTLVITSHGGLGLAVRGQKRKQPGDSGWSNPGEVTAFARHPLGADQLLTRVGFRWGPSGQLNRTGADRQSLPNLLKA